MLLLPVKQRCSGCQRQCHLHSCAGPVQSASLCLPSAGAVPELVWVINQGSTPALSAAAALEKLVSIPSGKPADMGR